MSARGRLPLTSAAIATLAPAACGGGGAAARVSAPAPRPAATALVAYVAAVGSVRASIDATLRGAHNLKVDRVRDRTWTTAGRQVTKMAAALMHDEDRLGAIRPPARVATAHLDYVDAVHQIEGGLFLLGQDLTRKARSSTITDVSVLKQRVSTAAFDEGLWRSVVLARARSLHAPGLGRARRRLSATRSR
jgi:hypothetical protein